MGTRYETTSVLAMAAVPRILSAHHPKDTSAHSLRLPSQPDGRKTKTRVHIEVQNSPSLFNAKSSNTYLVGN